MLEPNIARKLSFHARHSLKEAAVIAAESGSPLVEPKHLLLALVREKGSLGSLLLHNMGINQPMVEAYCVPHQGGTYPSSQIAQTTKKPITKIVPVLSSGVQGTITRAYLLASKNHYPYVGSEHLIYALIESSDPVLTEILASLKSDPKQVKHFLKTHMGPPGLPHLSQLFELPEISFAQPKTNISDTPFLDQYGLDITRDTQAESEILITRPATLTRMTHVLSRKQKNNPLLIGEPGVGKTTLVRTLARTIREGVAGPKLAHQRIVSIDLAMIVAGTNFRGEFEARLKEIIQEVSEHPDIILFIDEIHTLVGAGNATGGLDAANILKPALSRGTIRCIGATTLTEYKRHIEKDAALERRFQPIHVTEPSPEETEAILMGCRTDYETFHNVTIPEEAVKAAVEFSVRYLPDRFLPDKAFDLIDEAAAATHHADSAGALLTTAQKLETEWEAVALRKEEAVTREQYDEATLLKEEEHTLAEEAQNLRKRADAWLKKHKKTLTRTDIAEVVARTTSIPLARILTAPTARLIRLEAALGKRIIGQTQAIHTLSRTLLRAWSGLSQSNRPLGSFLFLGPSGVGKTLTAKTLAELLFENDKALVRIDMSEFMERHNVARLIGAPAGYVGYGEGGQLTERIRRQPYSVVLFDEIEKAHPDVFHLLLQILDEGSLTDAEGRRVSFTHTVVILTSNLGTEEFLRETRLGFGERSPAKTSKAGTVSKETSAAKAVMEKVKRELRPELLNRLNHIAVFHPLDKRDIARVVALELNSLKRHLAAKHITLLWNKRVLDYLAVQSLSVREGARLVRKNIEEHVEISLAHMLLTHPAPVSLSLTIQAGKIHCTAAKTNQKKRT